MTTAVAHAAGSSTALSVSRTGYWVSWSELRLPIVVGYEVGWCRINFPATGYQVAWAALRVPYVIVSVTLIQGGGGSSDKVLSKRRIVNDDIDLQDLAELWGMFRKAA